MTVKNNSNSKLNSLRIDSTAIQEIRLHGEHICVISNNSANDRALKILAAHISNDGYVTPAAARQALMLFSSKLRKETRDNPAAYPAIARLEKIARGTESVRCDIIRDDKHKPIPVRLLRALPDMLKTYETPFYVYDETGIREAAQSFKTAFSWVKPAYRNYFAVKACPNPHIVRILQQEGFGADCSSMSELVIAEKLGFKGEDIMFTSNDTPAEEYRKAVQLGAIINLDDITHIDYLARQAGMPELICFRYNPGPLRKGNDIIGDPQEAKYGVTSDQIIDAYKKARALGAKRFGLHTMVVSNMLDERYLAETAVMLFELAIKINRETGIRLEFINLGGGFGTPYKPEQIAIDLKKVSSDIQLAYRKYIEAEGLAPLRIVTECGRAITGPHGFLVTGVRHVTHKYKDYVGADACMANLMRPALYGAYHHISVLNKQDKPRDHIYDVTGSLCENNDKFAVNRPLPEIVAGDILIIHNAGAHGHAMGFQYNGKLRSAELLLEQNGNFRQIRKPESVEDYFATIEAWPQPIQ